MGNFKILLLLAPMAPPSALAALGARKAHRARFLISSKQVYQEDYEDEASGSHAEARWVQGWWELPQGEAHEVCKDCVEVEGHGRAKGLPGSRDLLSSLWCRKAVPQGNTLLLASTFSQRRSLSSVTSLIPCFDVNIRMNPMKWPTFHMAPPNILL